MEAVSTLIARQLELTLENSDLALHCTLAVDCFNIFTICIRTVETAQGFKQLATACAGYFCRTFYRLAATDPTSGILEDFRQRYRRALSFESHSAEFPSRHSMIMIDALIRGNWNPRPIWRNDDRPSDREHIRFARDIAWLAQVECRRGREVPEWIVDFAFDSLYLDPLPPASVITDCLRVVAIELDWDVPYAVTSDMRYICLSPVISPSDQNQFTSRCCLKLHHPESRNPGPKPPIQNTFRVQDDLCATPIRDLSGATWQARVGQRNYGYRSVLKASQFHVLRQAILHHRTVWKTQFLFPKLGDCSHFAAHRLEGHSTWGKRRYWVGCGCFDSCRYRGG